MPRPDYKDCFDMTRFKNWTPEAAYDATHRKPAKAVKAETANRITANILRTVNAQPGGLAYRVNNTGIWDTEKGIFRKTNTEKGIPDIIGCLRGRSLWIEVKAGRDRLSDDQKMRKFEIERAGGLYFEARSTDSFLEWFKQILTQ